jgi:uncharacterized membrane protein
MVIGYYCLGKGYWVEGFIGLTIFLVIIGLIIKVVMQKIKLKKLGALLPFDIIKTRYAKGEISKTEFVEKKKELE